MHSEYKRQGYTVTELEAILLSVVRDKGPSHGLDIGREAESRTGKLMGAGSLYRALHRLEREGYLRAYWEQESPKVSHRGPRRRYYELSGAGANALAEYLGQLARTARVLGIEREPAV